MDLTHISEPFIAENTLFLQSIEAAINESVVRRRQLQQDLMVELLSNLQEEVSDTVFYTVLDTLKKMENLDELLCQAGFTKETTKGWLNKEIVPPAPLRKPLLEIIMATAFDRYVLTGPRQELRRFLETAGNNAFNPVAKVGPKELPLEQNFSELEIAKTLPVRVLNGLVNSEFVVLGEILAASEMEILRVPNLGRKSLNQLNEALRDVFGVGVGSLVGDERARFWQMHEDRDRLVRSRGEAIESNWKTLELKPEYRDSLYEERLKKQQEVVEVHIEVIIDSGLIEALTQAGIVYKTQLATAPQSVIDQICLGHEDWLSQLETILSRGNLRLRTPIPLFLADTVDVYRE